MRIIKPTFKFMDTINGKQIIEFIEKAGHIFYKSEDKITVDSSIEFIQKIIQSGHKSVIEHKKSQLKLYEIEV